MSIILKHDTAEPKSGTYTNLYIERDGETASTVLAKVDTAIYYYMESWEIDVDCEFDFLTCGDFLLIESENWPIAPKNGCSYDLCCYEEEASKTEYVRTSGVIWPHIPLRSLDGHLYKHIDKRSHKNGTIEAKTHAIKFFRDSIVMMKGIDSPSARWIFPHPNGTRAAHQHFINTNFEDDKRRFSSLFSEIDQIIAKLLSNWIAVDFNEKEQKELQEISYLLFRRAEEDIITGLQKLEKLGAHWLFALFKEQEGQFFWQRQGLIFYDWPRSQFRGKVSDLSVQSGFQKQFRDFLKTANSEWKALADAGCFTSILD